MQYDRNGVLVKTTQAAPTLRKVKRTVLIDSRDRDVTKFQRISPSSAAGTAPTSDPGDYVVYLPRPFENVTSIRLMSAELAAPSNGGFTAPIPYILLSLEGLNRMDETAPAADRSGYIDTAFAKVPTNITTALGGSDIGPGTIIYYNDKISPENITTYNPPIANLNRIHVTWRHHKPGVWNTLYTTTATSPIGEPITFGTSENSLMLEIEYLDNGFDDFSTFQSFVGRGRGY
jgi:hypothetical protein